MVRGVRREEQPEQLFRARESFAVPAEGFPRVIQQGALIRADDPLVKTHAHLLEPASRGVVEQATAAPGERRSINPTVQQGQTGDEDMPHRSGNVKPGDPDSPASSFAPAQPAAGVVADDVPDVQNPGGGPKASQVDAKAAKVEQLQETATDPAHGAGPVPAGQHVEGDKGSGKTEK